MVAQDISIVISKLVCHRKRDSGRKQPYQHPRIVIGKSKVSNNKSSEAANRQQIENGRHVPADSLILCPGSNRRFWRDHFLPSESFDMIVAYSPWYFASRLAATDAAPVAALSALMN